MPDRPKTHQELTTENAALKERIRELEAMVAERKRSEQALRESEEKYRILFESINDAVFLHTMDEQGLPGRFLQVNDEACRRLGYTREELLTLTPRDITIPEEYERIANKRIGLASGASILMETIHLTKDGRKIPVEGNIRRFQYFGMQAALSISRDLTERSQMQEALQESESRLNAMLQSIPDHMSVMDKDLNIVWANETALRMFDDNIIGRKCYEAYHGRKEPCEPYPCLTLKAFQDGGVHEHDTDVVDTEGQTIHFHCTANVALRDKNDNPLTVLEISRNITEARQLEEKLKKSHDRYRELSTLLESLFNAIPDVLGIQDNQHGIIRYNQAGFDFLGRTQQEVEGKKCFGLINRTKPCDICATSEVFRTKKPARVEKYIEDMGIWLDCRSYPVFDEEGNISKIIEHLRDITERKLAENALQKSEEMLRLITDNMSDMIRVTDLKGVNLFTSPSHFKGLGYRPEERVGKSAFDIVHPEDLERIINIFSEGLAADRRITVEYRVKHADGRYVWLETVGDLLKDAQGNVTAVVMSSRDISDRRQAEETLQESETLQRTLLANLPAGVIIIDPVTRIIENVNNAAVAMFGVKAEFIVGRRCHSFLCPASEGACPVCDLGKEVDNTEREMVCADGSRRPVLKSVKRIQLRGQEKLLECFVDITAQKRAEEALRKSEEKYRLIAENSKDVIWTMGLDGRFTYVSPSVTMHAGYSPEEAMAMTLDTNLYKEDLPWAMEEIAREMKKPREQRSDGRTLEVRQYKKDGSVLDVEVSVAWLYNEQGETVGLQGSTRDISARKRAEEVLWESETRFRTLFSESPVSIIIHDKETGEILDSNEIAYRAYGLSSLEELQANEFWTEPPYSADDALRWIHKAAAEGVQQFEWKNRKANGDVFWEHVTLRLIAIGGLERILSVGIDITERKQAEEEREKLQAQLTRAQKLESVGTLAGGIAHDFNNLLMGIQGHASLMMLGLDPSDPNHVRLKHIEELVQSGAGLTGQLLGFARGGRYDVKPVSMNDIVEKSSAMFSRTKKEISIHCKYAQDPCIVEAGRSQMEQVFMNLFVNAWQAMPGGGDMFIETEKVVVDEVHAILGAVEPGRYVKVTVTDTGAGMDAQTKERIFDPFFTTKGMGRGTGLGLATVYGIMRGHGGMITAESEPDQGTTFTLYLPASERAPAEKEKTAEAALRGTETILLVDDERMVLEVSRDLLESLGYRVYVVGSGQETVAVYMEKRGGIDLVILDMVMPGISGGETFDRLREINPQVKVLLASGYSINGQAQEIINRGCNGFIQKPFRLKELSRRVREALD